MSQPSDLDSKHSKRTYLLRKQAIKQIIPSRGCNFFKMTSNYTRNNSRQGCDQLNIIPTTTIQSQIGQIYQNSQLLEKQQLKNIPINRNQGYNSLQNTIIKSDTQTLPVIRSNNNINFQLSKKRKGFKALIHQVDPLYVRQQQQKQYKNIQKLKRYQRLWRNKQFQRDNYSLLNRSIKKSQEYMIKHNILEDQKQYNIQFKDMLRNPQNKVNKKFKGLYAPQIIGLKGKGGSVKSFFEQIYIVEQVYKSQKKI